MTLRSFATAALLLAAVSFPARASSLDKTVITEAVKGAMPKLRACYDAERKLRVDVRGTIYVTWTIAPEGTVATAEVKASTIGSKTLEECVVAVVRGLHFPPSAPATEPVTVTYPFNFASGDKSAPGADGATVTGTISGDAAGTAPVMRRPGTPRVLATCGRTDSWRASASISLELPSTPAGRKAFGALCGARLEALRRCYEKTFPPPPVARETVVAVSGPGDRTGLALALSAAGKVVRVDVLASKLVEPARACVVKAFVGLVVPRAADDPERLEAGVTLGPAYEAPPFGFALGP